MPNWPKLINQIRQQPVESLGRKDVSRVAPWALGYEDARRAAGLSTPACPLHLNQLQDWVEQEFHWTKENGCRQNAVNFARLFSDDDATAFARFFEFCDKAGVLVAKAAFEAQPLVQPDQSASLLNRLKEIRQRPAMYFGTASIGCLFAYFKGYERAEEDLARSAHRSTTSREFQSWIDLRYPFAKGQPWDRTLLFLALQHQSKALESFFDLFEMFMSQMPPKAMGKVAQQLTENILGALEKSGHVAENTRSRIQDQAKKMAP